MKSFIEEYTDSFNQLCSIFSYVIKRSIKEVEEQIGRKLTPKEVDDFIRLGVLVCFLKIFGGRKKGV